MLLKLAPVSQQVEHAGSVANPINVPDFQNQRFVAHIDLTLPVSLTTLKPRVGNETALQIALLHTLDVPRKNVRYRFPVLR